MRGTGHPLSLDLRERVVAVIDGEDVTYQEAADRFRIGIATVKRLMRLRRETGSLAPRRRGPGPARLLDQQKDQALAQLVQEKADRTLPELVSAWEERTQQRLSPSTVGRALQRLELTLKKKHSSPRSSTGQKSSSGEPSSISSRRR